MNHEQRVVYYEAAKGMYEAFAIRLTAEEPGLTILAAEREERVRDAILQAQAYLYELLHWVDSPSDDIAPPHPRIHRGAR